MTAAITLTDTQVVGGTLVVCLLVWFVAAELLWGRG